MQINNSNQKRKNEKYVVYFEKICTLFSLYKGENTGTIKEYKHKPIN